MDRTLSFVGEIQIQRISSVVVYAGSRPTLCVTFLIHLTCSFLPVMLAFIQAVKHFVAPVGPLQVSIQDTLSAIIFLRGSDNCRFTEFLHYCELRLVLAHFRCVGLACVAFLPLVATGGPKRERLFRVWLLRFCLFLVERNEESTGCARLGLTHAGSSPGPLTLFFCVAYFLHL